MSEIIEDGGPAFPVGAVEATPGGVPWIHGTGGMSLRDYFAGQALAGLYANAKEEWNAETAAACAYDTADAMLAERQVGEVP